MWHLISRLMKSEATAIERTAQAQQEVDRQAQYLALYHFEGCPFCTRVRRVLQRLNVELALHDINRDPEARQALITGGGKKTVPCLRIERDGAITWLYESRDIIDYLEKRFAAIK
ncbi:glutaredoxin family protein [Chromohalobacter nigrandesensis]|uniref:glutaredoxin family protein n=1 Tax=Chromohalobacter nigrandesensis TaxID=119863 RepID=UPI001FF15DA0|nr:glutaredoxin [Chromohalobacter nigrandesensis]MCK0746012.1 glutathione S-transferase N-terminal domain-containing protein [Chromohalobacter nigrandesensis]